MNDTMGIPTSHVILLILTTVGFSMIASLGAVYYFRRIGLPRPAIGVFNSRDIVIVVLFIAVVPLLYLAMPTWILSVVVTAIFVGILLLGFRPVAGRWVRWPMVAVLVGATILIPSGPSYGNIVLHWVINSLVVVLVVVAAANVNVQGGMRLAHATGLALAFGVYDGVFAWAIPLTPRVMTAFAHTAIAPASGMQFGDYGAFIGTGDLLVYAWYAVAAYKAYRAAGLWVASVAIVVFGGVLPGLVPTFVYMITHQVITLVPAQVIFAPAALVGYLLLRRRGREESMRTHIEEQQALSAAAS